MLSVVTLAVVGAAYPNPGKMPARRFEIALCRPCDPVELRPEPKNPHDPRAVAVFSERGVQLGYLTAERCGLIKRQLEAGRQVDAVFQAETPFGALIRVGFDGAVPLLPVDMSMPEPEPPTEHLELVDPDPGYFPDFEPSYD